MYLYKTYWHYPETFTEDECNKIVDSFKGVDVDIGLLDETWVYEKVIPFIEKANMSAEWNYQWDFLDTLQFRVYNKNCFDDWHTDISNGGQPQIPTHTYINRKELIPKWGKSKPGIVGKIRKLSFILLLNDSSEFEGGEVEIQSRNFNMNDIGQTPTDIVEVNYMTKGSLMVFPSHLFHRVLPVTKGVRISLKGWCWGYPFK